MSWLSKGIKKLPTVLGYKAAEKFISNVIPHQHSADRRMANQAAAEQIDFYKKQKDIMEKENSRLENERKQNEDKINRKQIRSARIAYRSPGFLDEQSSGISEKLG